MFYHQSMSKRRMIVALGLAWLVIVLSVTLYVTLGRNPELSMGIICIWENVLKNFVSTKIWLKNNKYLLFRWIQIPSHSQITVHLNATVVLFLFKSNVYFLEFQVYWYLLTAPFIVISVISTCLYLWVGCMIRKISTQTGPRNIRESKRFSQQRKVLFVY